MTTIGTVGTGTSPAKSAQSANGLSNVDFLKVFAAKMQNQNPLAAMDENAMMSELSSLNSLSSQSQMENLLSSLVSSLSSSSSLSAIGKIAMVEGSGFVSDGSSMKLGLVSGSDVLSVSDASGNIVAKVDVEAGKWTPLQLPAGKYSVSGSSGASPLVPETITGVSAGNPILSSGETVSWSAIAATFEKGV